MSNIRLVVNNIELNMEKLVFSNKERFTIEFLQPRKEGKFTLLPLQLIKSIFGFTTEWSEDKKRFSLRRGSIELKFTLGSNEAYLNGKKLNMAKPLGTNDSQSIEIPLGIFTKLLDFRAYWEDETAFIITDPLTLPFYQDFTQKHSLDQLQEIFFVDLDEDGVNEFYAAYLTGENEPALAVITKEKQWLFDDRLLIGENLINLSFQWFKVINCGNKKVLAVSCIDAEDQGALAAYAIHEGRLSLIDSFTASGLIKIIGEEIQVINRVYDTTQHVINSIYRWDEGENKFSPVDNQICYWLDKNHINRREPESVALGFCEAIAINFKDGALSYCTDQVGDIESLADYHYYHKPAGQKNFFKIDVIQKNEDQAVLIGYYANFYLNNYIKPNRIIRMVLELLEDEWKITYIKDMKENLPTIIYWTPNLDVVSRAGSIFTNQPKYFLHFNSPKKVKMCSTTNSEPATQLIINCCYLEIEDLLPGINLKFYDQDKLEALAIFESRDAKTVDILKNDLGDYEIYVNL